MHILFEDDSILVVAKQRNIPSQPDLSGEMDAFSWAQNHCNKKKGFQLGLIHRLDRPVGGLLIFSKNHSSLRHLNQQMQTRQIKKNYLAIVSGVPSKKNQTLSQHIKKLRTINMAKIYEAPTQGTKPCSLSFQVLSSTEDNLFSLLSVSLHTGRFHQIRAQLSSIGHPIWGDRKYNKAFVKSKEPYSIGLWAYQLSFTHPLSGEKMEFEYMPSSIVPWTLFPDFISFSPSQI